MSFNPSPSIAQSNAKQEGISGYGNLVVLEQYGKQKWSGPSHLQLCVDRDSPASMKSEKKEKFGPKLEKKLAIICNKRNKKKDVEVM